MPLKVAFWNINTGQGSYHTRRTTFRDWCADADPDLLILEEVSHTLEGNIEGLSGMDEVARVKTLTRQGKESTKELWALQKNGLDFTGRGLRLPDLESVRMCLKVSSQTYDLAIWGIHANASRQGGRTAVAYAHSNLKINTKNLIGGDFNCPYTYAAAVKRHAKVCRPQSWEGNDLLFSQWKKEFGRGINPPNAALHLQTLKTGLLTPKPNPNGVIDYVLFGTSRAVAAAPNCGSEALWVDVLKNFDHCPVVYNVS